MADLLASFFRVAWKLALTLTAVKCAHFVVRHVSAGELHPFRFRKDRRDTQVQDDTETESQPEEQLPQEREQGSEHVQREVELLHQEVAFWRRMEHLARKEIWRKDEALKHVEVLLEAQNARVLLLESQARESAAMIQERESAFMEERACMATQLDARRAELRQLVPPDTHTDAEVMQLVRNLNVQISQTATLLTDTFTPVADVEAQRASAEFTEAHERARHAVGPIMAELLESINHEDDPILVHIALQTDIVGFAAGIISSWDFQHQSNSTFAGIHKQMLKSESQSVAGRWRALTRQYSKQRLYQGRDLSEGFTTQLAERMCDILTVSGARASVADMRHSVFRNFATVVRLALELQEVIGEGVTSRDLDVVVVRMDDVFVPETMEDVYGGLGAGEQEQLHVLCTAALGLRRCEKPADGLGDELQVSTLVKPKVVLETLVYELGLVEEDEPDTEDNMIV